LASVLEKTLTLVVEMVHSQGKKPIQNVNVKIYRIEKEPITPQQWAENLKNGSSFKSLVLSMNTNDKGKVTAELPEGVYEAKVEKYGLTQFCDLKQNVKVIFVEPRKRWWQ